MNPFDPGPPNQKKPVDYTGLKVGLILAPVFVLFALLDKPDMGLAVCIVLGMTMLAVKMRWYLRRHFWFWAMIVLILALQVPLVFLIRVPQGDAPTLLYAMPVGIADFLVVLGAIGLAERVFSRGASSNGEGE